MSWGIVRRDSLSEQKEEAVIGGCRKYRRRVARQTRGKLGGCKGSRNWPADLVATHELLRDEIGR